MTKYTCPNCHGGFPEPDPIKNGQCPWCGQSLDGGFEVQRPRVISHTVDEDDKPQTLLDKFLGLFK